MGHKDLILRLPATSQHPQGQLVKLVCRGFSENIRGFTVVRRACQMTFARPADLRQHMRAKHGIIFDSRIDVIKATAKVLTGDQLARAESEPQLNWDGTPDGMAYCFILLPRA